MNPATQPRKYQPKFDSDLLERSQNYVQYDDRTLFHSLVNIEHHPGVLPVAYHKLQAYCEKIYLGDDSHGYNDTALAQWINNAIERTQDIKATSPSQCKNILHQYSPTALVEGCWLQSTSQVATCTTEVAARLFRIFSFLSGEGQSVRHMGNRYRTLLNLLEFDPPNVTSRQFSAQPDVIDSAFESPVIQLCLAQFPRCFLPENLGYTLAHVHGLSRFFRWITIKEFEALGLPLAYLNLHLEDKRILQLRSVAIDGVKIYLNQFSYSSEQPRQWQRVLSGFRLYQDAEQNLFDAIHYRIKHPLSLPNQVLALFQRKAPYGLGHHHRIKLGNINLDQGLSAIDAKGNYFLNELIQSDYFDLENPTKSKFISETTAFGGPMFGVFNQAELDLLRQWVASESQNAPVVLRSGTDSSTNRAAKIIKRPGVKRDDNHHTATATKTDIRELFYALVNIDLFPQALPLAKQIVLNTLQKSTARLNKKHPDSLRFFNYDVATFEQRILDIYHGEMRAYKPFTPPPKLDKAVYPWAIEQFAPAILTDGCWLQQTSRAGINLGEINARLLAIFADEIGNGHTQWNHPNVYRKLLSSLEIELPDIDSKNFARYPGFSTAAFDLPVFMLSISQFPTQFLPELLGLNMAIEISGLGAAYMRLADELDYWGIDSTIIKLHISIDNMADGHSSIAKDTIALYLDQQLSACGDLQMQQQWRRVWSGFLSLPVVLQRFKRVLAWTYIKRFAIPGWWHNLTHPIISPD